MDRELTELHRKSPQRAGESGRESPTVGFSAVARQLAASDRAALAAMVQEVRTSGGSPSTSPGGSNKAARKLRAALSVACSDSAQPGSEDGTLLLSDRRTKRMLCTPGALELLLHCGYVAAPEEAVMRPVARAGTGALCWRDFGGVRIRGGNPVRATALAACPRPPTPFLPTPTPTLAPAPSPTPRTHRGQATSGRGPASDAIRAGAAPVAAASALPTER